jgi:hypothetical protein
LPAKPDEIKTHEKGQSGNEKEKGSSQEQVSFQERMEAPIGNPNLDNNEDQEGNSKEERFFKKQESPKQWVICPRINKKTKENQEKLSVYN